MGSLGKALRANGPPRAPPGEHDVARQVPGASQLDARPTDPPGAQRALLRGARTKPSYRRSWALKLSWWAGKTETASFKYYTWVVGEHNYPTHPLSIDTGEQRESLIAHKIEKIETQHEKISEILVWCSKAFFP